MSRPKRSLALKSQSGLTTAELLSVLLIAGILVTVAVPVFSDSSIDCDDPSARPSPMMRARIAEVTGDLGEIHLVLSRYELSNNRYPVNLAEAGLDNLVDPWGNPYQYLVVFGRKDVGPVRKDHDLKPVNKNYDIYSMGPDGRTETPFTSKLGEDDIVMANDGDYFGPACQYTGTGKK